MTDNNYDELTPIDVPLTRPASATEEGVKYWYQNKTIVFSLVATLVLALAVIFLLPNFISPREAPAVEVARVSPVSNGESPFQQQQASKARREAQDILNKLLEKQQQLEKRQVTLWANDPFQAALATAKQGDLKYRQGDYSGAITDYREADNQLKQLIVSIPSRLESLIDQGNLALKEGQADAAVKEFDAALTIDPQNADAQKGKQRGANLEQVLSYMTEGDQAREDNDLPKALERYQQALQLDPDFLSAKTAVEKVSSQIAQQHFMEAMSRGYEALDEGNLEKARRAFTQALTIHPNDEAANSALTQARNQMASRWLANSLNQASQFEQQEHWQKASDVYQQVLDRDASVIDARVGKIRADARAQLDQQIEKIINQPERLATPAVLTAARKTLADAKAIPDPGQRLQGQITSMQQTLGTASQPLTVNLVSDDQTRVTVYKVGELGHFSQRELLLKPGRYVAVGSRKGYRDVRVEFVVDANRQNRVEIICREPIS